MKIFSELGKKISSGFSCLFSHLPHNKVATFFVYTLSILAVVLLYPIALFFSFPSESAWFYFKNNPNYSVFSLVVLPLAVGLFSVILREFRGYKIPKLWKIWLIIGGLPIIVTMVLPDALDKGPPIQPTHLRLSSSQQQEVLDLEKSLRERYWNNKPSDPNELRQKYITSLSNILEIPETKVLKFHDFEDFLERASFVAYADLVISFVGAAFAVIIFWFLGFLQLKAVEISDQQKDAIAWVYMFFFIWIPCRLYSIWHQNFYSLVGKGEIFLLAVIVGYAGLLLLASLYAKGALARAVAIFQGVSATLIGVIILIKPNSLLAGVGKTVSRMSARFLVSSEIVLLTLLLSVIWRYLEDENSVRTRGDSR